MLDQFGETVDLYDFCDQVVYIQFNTMWCGACSSSSGGAEAEYQARIPQGGMYLSVLIENLDSQVPSQEDLTAWATTYGLTMPVLSDAEEVVYDFASGSIGLPYTVLLDRGEVVSNVGSASFADMDELLAQDAP